eukprot:4383472-Amphidinium_carterae.1
MSPSLCESDISLIEISLWRYGDRSTSTAVKQHHIHSIKAYRHAHAIRLTTSQTSTWVGGSADQTQTQNKDIIHWSTVSVTEIND